MRTIEASVLADTRDLETRTLGLDDPAGNEVLVDIRATGVCHTDHHVYAGNQSIPLPAVLGHEGAGVVEAVGSGVTSVSPGDRVVCAMTVWCGTCEYCATGRPYLCERSMAVSYGGTMLDGTRRLHDGDDPINHFFAQSSFATAAVVPANCAVPVPDDVPFEVAALLGCGASTGIGAVLNTAGAGAGDSIAVFGCGGVGMSAVMAADAISAGPIIAVDLVPDKLDVAVDLGATHTVDPEDEDPVDRIRELTGGGADYTFEFIGNPAVMTQAVESARMGATAVLVGAAGRDEAIPISGFEFLPAGKTVRGSVGGSIRPPVDIPRFARMDAAGDLDLGALVSATYGLDELDDAFAAMEAGDVIRGVLTP